MLIVVTQSFDQIFITNCTRGIITAIYSTEKQAFFSNNYFVFSINDFY